MEHGTSSLSLLSSGCCGSDFFYSYSSGLWGRSRVRTDMYVPSAEDIHGLSTAWASLRSVILLQKKNLSTMLFAAGISCPLY